jgi:hypothetical protein
VASFTYNGEEELVFPTLGVTVKKGDTIDAPADFSNPNFSAGKGKPAPVAPSNEEVTK